MGDAKRKGKQGRRERMKEKARDRREEMQVKQRKRQIGRWRRYREENNGKIGIRTVMGDVGR